MGDGTDAGAGAVTAFGDFRLIIRLPYGQARRRLRAIRLSPSIPTTNTLDIAAFGNLSFGGVEILDDNAGAMTLEGIDASDTTTEGTVEGAIDTLANLTSV